MYIQEWFHGGRVGGVAGKIRLLPSEVNVKNLCQYFIFMTEGVCGDLHDVTIKYTASFLVINIVASLYEISLCTCVW